MQASIFLNAPHRKMNIQRSSSSRLFSFPSQKHSDQSRASSSCSYSHLKERLAVKSNNNPLQILKVYQYCHEWRGQEMDHCWIYACKQSEEDEIVCSEISWGFGCSTRSSLRSNTIESHIIWSIVENEDAAAWDIDLLVDRARSGLTSQHYLWLLPRVSEDDLSIQSRTSKRRI